MTLHEDKDTFNVLLEKISIATGIRADIIEKDYYVTVFLQEFSEMQSSLPAYFKGGTALYKGLKTLNRFSEDIDITVDIANCTTNQCKVRLEQATKKYKSLPRTKDKNSEINKKNTITTVYEYNSIVSTQSPDALQRFGTIKVEGTSFTLSEPYTTEMIEPILYTKATTEDKATLIQHFDVKPFEILVMKQERIFADKIFATEYYYIKNSVFDVCKHLYDLTILYPLEKIQILVNNPHDFSKMLNYVREEDKNRLGSSLSTMAFSNFTFFTELKNHESLEQTFEQMQKTYVFQLEDKVTLTKVIETMDTLYEILLKIK